MHSEVKVLNNAEKPTSRDAVIITLRCTSPILMEFNEQATREYQNFLYMRQQKPQLYKVARASNGQMTVTATPWTNTTRIARVAMSKDQRSELMKWLDTFKNNAEWYHSTGRAYKLSVLTWGPPGTGKTLLGKAICGYLGVNIAGLNLSVFRNDAELDEVLSKIPKGTALAFDDLDAHCEGLKPREIVKREAKEREERKAAGKEHDALSPHQGVTLSRFLRLLDGDDEDGRITIASTNFPNLMDSAVTRAGRFDVSIHMKPCTEETVRFLYREFYKVDLPDDCMPNLQLYRELNPAEVEGAMMMNRDDAIAGAAAIRDLKPRELEVDDADLMFRIDEDATAEYRQRVLAQQANQLSESVSNLHAAFPLSSNDE
jgi:SpoVK/Ycf46/Vps4 family AAA+-type ATPase